MAFVDSGIVMGAAGMVVTFTATYWALNRKIRMLDAEKLEIVTQRTFEVFELKQAHAKEIEALKASHSKAMTDAKTERDQAHGIAIAARDEKHVEAIARIHKEYAQGKVPLIPPELR